MKAIVIKEFNDKDEIDTETNYYKKRILNEIIEVSDKRFEELKEKGYVDKYYDVKKIQKQKDND